MLTEALEYPRNHDDWLKTVIIGGLLSLFTFLIVPGIILAGYIVRVIRGAMTGDETPPAFEDWGGLFSDGLGAAVIAFVYAVIPALIVTVTVFMGGALALGGSDAALGAGTLVILVGGLVGLVLSLLSAYVIPAAVANYVDTGRMGAGFSVSALRPVLFNGTYATAWATGFGIILVAGLVAGLLNVIPFLGVLIGAFLGFYAAVAAYYVIGRAWAEMNPVEPETMESPESSPVI